MLLLYLVVALPGGVSPAALRDALASRSLSEAAAPEACLPAARAIAEPHVLEPRRDDRLGEPGTAVAAIREVTGRLEGALLVVVGEAVAREVLRHALALPDASRFACDPGCYSEIEVRLMTPWTVAVLNERCHADGDRLGGIVPDINPLVP